MRVQNDCLIFGPMTIRGRKIADVWPPASCDLASLLDPFNAAVASFLAQAQAFFLQQTGDPAASQQLAWQQLENLRQQQASSLAYFDTFWMMAVLTFAVAFAVLIMKRSVAEKGAHAGPE